jgi:hypothetical protein
MSRGGQLAAHLLSTACGLLMVAAVGVGTSGSARVATLLALGAVVAATLLRPAATLAVLCTVLVIALSAPPAVAAAVAGLSAAVYLVLRHGASSDLGLDSMSPATLVGAVGLALAGLAATAFPWQLPWLPLLAPLAVFAIYLLAARPFVRDEDG